jgi:NAD(P)-dependent dehydrogenase (short-subunit alcohol dehydrogenase family)
MAEVGRSAIDIPLNSAGIVGRSNQTVGNVDYESWAEVFNINVMGPLRMTEASPIT